MALTLRDAVERDLFVKAVVKAFLPLVEKEDKPKVRAYANSKRLVTKLGKLKRIIKADPEAASFPIWENFAGLVSLSKGILEGFSWDFETQKVEPAMDEVLMRLVREVLFQIAKTFVQEVRGLGGSFYKNADVFLNKPVDKKAVAKFVRSEKNRIDGEVESFKKRHPWIEIEGTSFEVGIGPTVITHQKGRPGGGDFGIYRNW